MSITISAKAVEALKDREIENESAFINDLIIDALTGDEDFFFREQMKRFREIQKDLEGKGYKVTLDHPKYHAEE